MKKAPTWLFLIVIYLLSVGAAYRLGKEDGAQEMLDKIGAIPVPKEFHLNCRSLDKSRRAYGAIMHRGDVVTLQIECFY